MATPVSNSVALPPVNGGNGTLTDEFLHGLVQGSSWQFSDGHTLTYSFSVLDTVTFTDPEFAFLPQTAWTAPLQDAFVQALASWSNVANITFQEVDSGSLNTASTADIAATLTGSSLQQFVGAGVVGAAFLPDPTSGDATASYPHPEGDVFFDNDHPGYASLYAGSFGLSALIHELGHALGLKHPHDDGGNGSPTFAQLVISGYDTERWTVMSYNNNIVSLSSNQAASPMPLDILAIQQIYGANMSFHAGDDVYHLHPDSNNPMSTIWDAGGHDTFDASGYGSAVVIDLTPGFGYVENPTHEGGLTAIAFNVTIEDAIGGNFNDTLVGNDAVNVLAGGAGNDLYTVQTVGDTVVELDGGGNDGVISSVSFTLPDNVEALVFTGTADLEGTGNAAANGIGGNFGNNLLSGLGGDDSLYGNEGNDTLDGGTGADYLDGGPGYDTYIVDNPGDFVEEDATGVILSSVSYTLIGGGPADLTLTGSADISGTGSNQNNRLIGNAGINVLAGGFGDDTYGVQNAGDSVVELPGFGTDLVQSSVSYTLGDNLENLTLTGSANLTGTGNAAANVINGNSGNNLLDGGAGNDSIAGGAGNDAMDGGSGADSLAGAGGNDILNGARGDDTLSGGAGDDSVFGAGGGDSLAGGEGGDVLKGIIGDDTLDGGNGADTLMGGVGNDLLLGGAGNDVIEGGRGDDSMNGGAGNDVFTYAGVFGAGDMHAGDADTIGGIDAGDVLDITRWFATHLRVDGSALGDGMTLPGELAAGSTNIAFDNANDLLMIDLDGNGVFDAAHDFSIELAGVAALTYVASGSSFTITLDS